MKLSFVVPVLNGEKTIRVCLESIVSQTLAEEFEILVVDNGSTDASREIALEFPVTVLKEIKKGAGNARNLGWKQARGEFVAFIDCDVRLSPNWSDVLLKEMDPWYAVIQGQIIPASFRKSWLDDYRLEKIRETSGGTFLNMNFWGQIVPMINTSACIYRKSACESAGGFHPDLRRCEDTEMAMRLFLSGYALKATSKTCAYVYYDQGIWNYLKRSAHIGYWTARFQQIYQKTVSPKFQNRSFYAFLNSCFHYLGWRLGKATRSKVTALPLHSHAHVLNEVCEMRGVGILCSDNQVHLHRHQSGARIRMESEENLKKIFQNQFEEIRFFYAQKWLSLCTTKDRTSSPSLDHSKVQEGRSELPDYKVHR